MTYGTLKNLTQGFLTGDTKLSNEPGVIIALVQMALHEAATNGNSLELLTDTPTVDTLRMGPGGFYIRNATLPDADEDVMDIETELCFAVARYIASYVSREKMEFHAKEATRIILNFNSKVDEVQQTAQLAADLLAEGTLQ